MTTSPNPPNPEGSNSSLRLAAFAGLIVVALFAGYSFAWHPERPPLTVYCAHDSVYSDKILHEFEKRTGIPVAIRYDTEATKSLGLVELISQEKNHPRCDVFWNNELLGTLSLAEENLLLPYKGPGYARIPDEYKDMDGRWTGFAARMRVWIINSALEKPSEALVMKTIRKDLGRVAIAKPLYGTTRTQYTILWHLWGVDKLYQWHVAWRKRKVREVDGNAAVKNLVAQGICDMGVTDTDDYFEAKDEGMPVGMVPVTLDNGATICIPNSVAIIRGTRREKDAQKLVDYLLSEECELTLAKSKSRQIPLGPVDETKLPEEVRQLKKLAASGYPLTGLGNSPRDCLAWLKSEYQK